MTASKSSPTAPDGMRKRIADEVPKWREIVAKAGIKPV